ncbi:hypothetical protein OnM2_096047, partial [Erysiphe neolycopersici]
MRTSLFDPQIQKKSQISPSTSQQYQQMPQQLEEKQNFEDYYQNLDISKQKEPVAPYKYPDIPQHTSSYPSNIPPPKPFHNPPLQQFNIILCHIHQIMKNNSANKSHPQNQYFKINTQVQSPQAYHQTSGHVFTGREITNLRRSYSEEMKYKGADDCLNLKLHVFYDLCLES